MKQLIPSSEFYTFCENYNEYDFEINENTLITDIAGYEDCVIDFLEAIDDEFQINFEEFDFKKYFLDETEIAKSVFKWGYSRSISEELRLSKLYKYIITHRR